MRFIYLAAAGELNLRSRAFVDFFPHSQAAQMNCILKQTFHAFFVPSIFFFLKDGMNHNTYLVVD